MDQVFIQHRFKISGQDGITLSDALILPIGEYQALTPEQIEALKNERLTNYIEFVKNPPQLPVPTKEELLTAINAQIAELTTRKAEIEAEPVKGGSK